MFLLGEAVMPAEMETVLEMLKEQVAYHRQQAERIEQALTLLEETAKSVLGNGAAAASAPQLAASREVVPEVPPSGKSKRQAPPSVESAQPVLNQEDVELAESPSEPAPPRRSRQQEGSFSLKEALLARYKDMEPNDAIVQVLTRAAQPVPIEDLFHSLYGSKVKKDLQGRALGALKTHMARGVKAGLWQRVSDDPPSFTV